MRRLGLCDLDLLLVELRTQGGERLRLFLDRLTFRLECCKVYMTGQNIADD